MAFAHGVGIAKEHFFVSRPMAGALATSMVAATEKGFNSYNLAYTLPGLRLTVPTYWLTARALPMFNRVAIQPFVAWVIRSTPRRSSPSTELTWAPIDARDFQLIFALFRGDTLPAGR